MESGNMARVRSIGTLGLSFPLCKVSSLSLQALPGTCTARHCPAFRAPWKAGTQEAGRPLPVQDADGTEEEGAVGGTGSGSLCQILSSPPILGTGRIWGRLVSRLTPNRPGCSQRPGKSGPRQYRAAKKSGLFLYSRLGTGWQPGTEA